MGVIYKENMEQKDKPKKLITFFLNQDLYLEFKHTATKNSASMSKLLVNFIKKYLDETKK